MSSFNYENKETKVQSGGKIVRKVSIKKGRGYKSITKYHKGKKMYTVRKPIHKEHVKLIKKGKFGKMLFPNKKFASSLYNAFGREYFDYLEETDVRSKIGYK